VRTLIRILPLAALLAVAPPGAGAAPVATPKETRPVTKDVYAFQVHTADGKERSLADFKGKVLLIVNTASKCGLTPQYEGLEKLYERYKDRGFEVVAFPANDFLWQEPGTDKEIQEFCSVNYGVTFPVFAKISVKGKHIAPLYQYLTKESPFPGDIGWNFAKFLVAPDGRIVARFDPKVEPLDKKVLAEVEAVLPAK
jgi:glutathione peroxidase